MLGPAARTFPQRGANFAERLFRVCEDMRRDGFRRLIISSSDSPQLPENAIHRSFELLERHDVVLGPAEDGGYYLIGLNLKKEPPDLFRGIPMSTSVVLAQTVARAESLGQSVALLEPMFDVDESHDLVRLHELLRRHGELRAPHTLAVLQQISTANWHPEAHARATVRPSGVESH